MAYSIDTSGLLDGWVRYYPPDVFPTVWARMEQLVANGDLIATEEVLRELEGKDDDVHKWAKACEAMFAPVDAQIQVEVSGIMQQFPGLVDAQRNRSRADPFVIGLARIGGHTVVTGEKPSGRPQKPNIPDVCTAIGVPCIGLLEMFRRQGWQV